MTKHSEKLIEQKIIELKAHFGLGDTTEIISEALRRCATADVQLKRHERLCESLPPGDGEFYYLKSELSRWERIQRFRFNALKSLLTRGVRKESSDDFGISTHFGAYVIPGKGNEWWTHWPYVLANPDMFGLKPRIPKKGVLRINGEVFLSEEARRQVIKEKHEWQEREGYIIHEDSIYDGCITDEYVALIKAAKAKAGEYEELRPSQFSFLPKSKQKKQEPEFDDEMPQPVDAKKLKSIRNRMDYLKRKAAKQ